MTSEPPPARRPERRTRASITEAALDLADAKGLEAVTLANVATAVDCKPPSLYTHFDNLADLRDEMAIAVAGQMSEVLRDSAIAKVGDDVVRAYAHAWREFARAHPARYRASWRTGPQVEDRLRDAAGVARFHDAILATIGVPEASAGEARRILHSTLHGYCVLEIGSMLSGATDATFELLVDSLIAGLRATFGEDPATPA